MQIDVIGYMINDVFRVDLCTKRSVITSILMLHYPKYTFSKARTIKFAGTVFAQKELVFNSLILIKHLYDNIIR